MQKHIVNATVKRDAVKRIMLMMVVMMKIMKTMMIVLFDEATNRSHRIAMDQSQMKSVTQNDRTLPFYLAEIDLHIPDSVRSYLATRQISS